MGEYGDRLLAAARSSGTRKKEDKGFLGGLIENVSNAPGMAMEMVGGVPQLLGSAVDTVEGTVKQPATLALGLGQALPGPAGDAAEWLWEHPQNEPLLNKDEFEDWMGALDKSEGFLHNVGTTWDYVGDSQPLVHDIPESFGGTLGRMGQVAAALSPIDPGEDYSWSDTEYGQAWSEGQIAPLVIEDVANAAAAGAVASSAVGATAKAATRAAAGEPTSGLLGAAGRRIARTAPESIPALEASATRWGTWAQGADRVSNPFAWPGAAARPALRRVAPEIVEEAGRGSLINAAFKTRSPAYRKWWDRRVARSEGMGYGLEAEAKAASEAKVLGEAWQELSGHDPVVRGAVVADARLGESVPVIRERLDAPVLGEDGVLREPGRELQQQRLDELVGNRSFEGSVPDRKVAQLEAQQNLSLDEFEMLEAYRAEQDAVAARQEVERYGPDGDLDELELSADEFDALQEKRARVAEFDELGEFDGSVSEAFAPVQESLLRVLDDKASSRLSAQGERFERHPLWDEVADDVTVDDVVAARHRVEDATKRAADAKKAAAAARRQADQFGADGDLDALGMSADELDAAVEDMYHAADEADLAAVQAKVALDRERDLLDATQQKAGRKEEQGSTVMDTYVERDVDAARAGSAPRDGMDAEVHAELAALRRQAIDQFGVDPDLHGLRDYDPGQMVEVTVDDLTGAEFREVIDEAVADFDQSWNDLYGDLDPVERPTKPSRSKVRGDAIREFAQDGRIEIHAGNRPGEWVEVTPSQITWSDLTDPEKRVRVRRFDESPSSMSDDVATWQRQWDDAVQRLREMPENTPPAVRRVRNQMDRAIGELRKDAELFETIDPDLAEKYWVVVDEAMEQLEQATQPLSGGAQVYGGVAPTGSAGGKLSARAKRLGSEQQLRSVEVPNSVEGQLRVAERNLRVGAQNEVRRTMVNERGAFPVAEGVWEGPDGQRYTADQLESMGWEQIDRSEVGVRRRRVSPDEAEGFVSLEDAQYRMGGDDTVWLPEGMREGFEKVGGDVLEGTWAERAAKNYDRGMGLWKAGVLALSPTWHLGNVLGNLFMTWVGAGVTPLDLWTFRDDVRKITGSPFGLRQNRKGKWKGRNPEVGGDVHKQRLVGSSNVSELIEGSFLADPMTGMGGTKKGGRLRQSGRTVVDRSFQMNQWVDNASHVVVYLKMKQNRSRALAELDGQLARKEISQEAYDERRAAADMTDEQAVAEALRVAGDFQRMSPAERGLVRRAMPFYSWYKHITKLAFSLPRHSPARTAWTLHLSGMYQDEVERPGWMAGMLNVGGDNWLSVSMVNPFAGVTGETNPLLNPARALGAASPAIQLPLNAWNIDTRQGGFLSHAPGHGPVDEDGRPTAGFVGWDTLSRQLTDLNPIARTGRGLLEEPVARYDSGDPVLIDGRREDRSAFGGAWWAPAASYLGFTVHDVDVGEQNRRTQERQRRRESDRRRYDRQRRRAGV